MGFNNIIKVLLLFLGWIILSGQFTAVFLFTGFVSSVATIWIYNSLFHKEFSFKKRHNLIILIIKLFIYLPWLLKEIFISTKNVAKIIWSNKKVTPTIEWIATNIDDDYGTTIYANSITLTPGTVTIRGRQGMIEVQALEAGSIEDLKSGVMKRHIKDIIK